MRRSRGGGTGWVDLVFFNPYALFIVNIEI